MKIHTGNPELQCAFCSPKDREQYSQHAEEIKFFTYYFYLGKDLDGNEEFKHNKQQVLESHARITVCSMHNSLGNDAHTLTKYYLPPDHWRPIEFWDE